jgi:hypothetical protein
VCGLAETWINIPLTNGLSGRPSGRKAAYAHPDVGSFELLLSRGLNTAWESVPYKIVCSRGSWHSIVWGLNELQQFRVYLSGCCIIFVEMLPGTWDQSCVQIASLWRILHMSSAFVFLRILTFDYLSYICVCWSRVHTWLSFFVVFLTPSMQIPQ